MTRRTLEVINRIEGKGVVQDREGNRAAVSFQIALRQTVTESPILGGGFVQSRGHIRADGALSFLHDRPFLKTDDHLTLTDNSGRHCQILVPSDDRRATLLAFRVSKHGPLLDPDPLA